MADSGLFPLVFAGGAILAAAAMQFALVASSYKRCPPNQAMIITGLCTPGNARSFKVIRSGGVVVLPMLQQCSFLSLEVMSVDLNQIGTMHLHGGQQITAGGNIQFKIANDEESIARAAEALLTKQASEIQTIVLDMVQSALQESSAGKGVEQLDEIREQTKRVLPVWRQAFLPLATV
jgi:flotillin